MSQNFLPSSEQYIPAHYFFNELPAYRPMAQLSSNIAESMRMMADIQSLRADLPGLDCGACGAPTCRAFAEDVIRGRANAEACVVAKAKKGE